MFPVQFSIVLFQFDVLLLQTHGTSLQIRDKLECCQKKARTYVLTVEIKAPANPVILNGVLRRSLYDNASVCRCLNCRYAWLHTVRHFNFLQQNRLDCPSSNASFELASHPFCIHETPSALYNLLRNVHFCRFVTLKQNSS